MTTMTIAEILKLSRGSIVPAVHGTITHVAERYPPTGMEKTTNSDGSVREWSIQSLVLQDSTGNIGVQVANKDPLGQADIGRSIYLIANKNTRGVLLGVKVDEENGAKLLRVTPTGELVFAQPAATVAQPISGAGTSEKAPFDPSPEGETVPAPSSKANNDQDAWANIAVQLQQFGDLYELCHARAARMNLADAEVRPVADALFQTMLDWFKGELPGELPKGHPQ